VAASWCGCELVWLRVGVAASWCGCELVVPDFILPGPGSVCHLDVLALGYYPT